MQPNGHCIEKSLENSIQRLYLGLWVLQRAHFENYQTNAPLRCLPALEFLSLALCMVSGINDTSTLFLACDLVETDGHPRQIRAVAEGRNLRAGQSEDGTVLQLQSALLACALKACYFWPVPVRLSF